MTQRAVPTASYENMPLSLVLFRYLWPFWLFKNAATGDRLTRAAAYRHNRTMRVHLPGYLLKWLCNCALAFGLIMAFDSRTAHASGLLSVMAAGAGVMFACAVTVLFVTCYIYVYLSHNGD
ncbi:hypothetical protein HNQ60_003247 [Povalibacter uvarum]|uniref:Uncharacterized protein n=1 Tax=Povalibacter uvarum TaxID=732238 RepID=A0A841HNC1_9GAMM|nr:hypothetical protein [Povalibacter uvarum]MBB6094366.1 hypothetical protein [Povalibacter uvarum]